METLAPLKVVVKTPDGTVADLQVDCDIEWSVSQLRKAIQDAHPNSPDPATQKLIYAGRLLSDEQLLCEAIKHTDAVQTIYLIVSTNERASSPSTSQDASSSATPARLAAESATEQDRPRSVTPPVVMPTAGSLMNTDASVIEPLGHSSLSASSENALGPNSSSLHHDESDVSGYQGTDSPPITSQSPSPSSNHTQGATPMHNLDTSAFASEPRLPPLLPHSLNPEGSFGRQSPPSPNPDYLAMYNYYFNHYMALYRTSLQQPIASLGEQGIVPGWAFGLPPGLEEYTKKVQQATSASVAGDSEQSNVAPATPLGGAQELGPADVGEGQAEAGAGAGNIPDVVPMEFDDDERALERNENQHPLTIAFKLILMLFLCGHRASPSKFAWMSVIAAGIFAHQMGWLNRFWPGNNGNAPNNPGAEHANTAPAAENDNNERQDIAAALNQNEGSPARSTPIESATAGDEIPAQIQVRPSVLQEIETFFVHLFSSLMPGVDPREVAAVRNR